MMEEPNFENDPQKELFWINHPSALVWAESIGKLILNFGALELLTYLWIAYLTDKNDIVLDLSSEMPLNRRIQLILELLRRINLEETKHNKISLAWKRAQPLLELRNAVAHNPIVFGWAEQPSNVEPDFIGIPNLKKRSLDVAVDRVKLKASIDAVAKLAQELRVYLDELSREKHT